MKLRYLTVLSALAFLLFSCGNNSPEEQNVPETHELLTVAMQDYTMSTEYPASIHGNQDIKIIPRVEGYLQGVHVKEGDAVKAGQLLFRIDDATYRAAVESANANVQMMTAALNRAQLEYDGKKTLRQQEIISDFELSLAESDLNVAKANLAAAKAALTSARNDLSYTEIRSPSDGVVGRIPYRKGDLVGPSIQDGLTVVADNGQMPIYFSMTENTVMQYLAEYQSLTDAISHFPELQLQLSNGLVYEQTGHVESISGVVDERTGAVSVCARFDNPNGMLLSGGTGQLHLDDGGRSVVIDTFLRQETAAKTHKGRISVNQMLTIIANGSSEFFVSMAGSLFAIIINIVLLKLGGSTAVAAVSIVEYIASLKGMVIYSMSDALQPAISYCFGAGLLPRMRKMQRVVMSAAAILSLFAMLFLLFGGKLLLPLFVKDGDVALHDMSLRAMRFYALSYLVSWVEMTLAGYLTALEKPWHSLAISLLGTFVFPLVFLAILVPIWQLDETGCFPGRDAFIEMLRRNGLMVRIRRRHHYVTTDSNHNLRKYPNLVKGLAVTEPNRVWVSDITYVETAEGVLYLSLVTDLYSHKIVGWAIGPTLEREYPLKALRMALATLPEGDVPTLIHHSDRGC